MLISDEEAKILSLVQVNGKKVQSRVAREVFELLGKGAGGTPLRWLAQRG